MANTEYGPDYWKTLAQGDKANYGAEYWKNMAQGEKTKKGKSKLRITIPAGEGYKLFNMAEISSAAGTTITVSLPFPMAESGLGKVTDSIRQIGGTVEFLSD